MRPLRACRAHHQDVIGGADSAAMDTIEISFVPDPVRCGEGRVGHVLSGSSIPGWLEWLTSPVVVASTDGRDILLRLAATHVTSRSASS